MVRDLRASELRRLGWTGPSIDRLLIVNKTGPEMLRDEGDNCVVARIQFDNRTEELGEGNLADARLIASAPTLVEVLREAREAVKSFLDYDGNDQENHVQLMLDYANALEAAKAVLPRIDDALSSAGGGE